MRMKNVDAKSGLLRALEVSIGTIHIEDLKTIAAALNCQYLSLIEDRRLILDIEDTTILYRESGAETKAVMKSGFKRHYLEACKELLKYGFLLRDCGVIPDGK